MMFLRINKVNLELELNDFFVMFFLINNFSDNMCQIQKTLTFYITTRTKLGYFKMRPDNLSRSKINFPFTYDKGQTCS